MSLKSWFPTVIYYASLQKNGAAGFNADLVKECHQIRDYDEEGRKWSASSYPGGYTSYSSMAQLHKFSSTFATLEEKITKHVRKYTQALEMDLRGKQIGMTDCWVNIMPKQVVHSLHLHPLSFISGTYYVQTPRNCSAIKFEDPRLSSFMAAPPKLPKVKDANRQFVKYKASAGKLVLFESWLRHEVASNQSDEERISISFNYNWW
jgi:uncharacterized protein (TIGR02466 family)